MESPNLGGSEPLGLTRDTVVEFMVQPMRQESCFGVRALILFEILPDSSIL